VLHGITCASHRRWETEIYCCYRSHLSDRLLSCPSDSKTGQCSMSGKPDRKYPRYWMESPSYALFRIGVSIPPPIGCIVDLPASTWCPRLSASFTESRLRLKFSTGARQGSSSQNWPTTSDDSSLARLVSPGLRHNECGGPARTHLRIRASPEGFRTGKRTRRELPKHLGKPSCHSAPYRVTDQNWSSRPQKKHPC